jgi:hypothetical protein
MLGSKALHELMHQQIAHICFESDFYALHSGARKIDVRDLPAKKFIWGF